MLVEDKINDLIAGLQVNERMADDATVVAQQLTDIQMELEAIVKKLTRDPGFSRALRNSELQDVKRDIMSFAKDLNNLVSNLNEYISDVEAISGSSGGDAGMGRFARFMR